MNDNKIRPSPTINMDLEKKVFHGRTTVFFFSATYLDFHLISFT